MSDTSMRELRARHAHAETPRCLLQRLLSGYGPVVYVDDGTGKLDRQIEVSALELRQKFRVGDDDDGTVYQLGLERVAVLALVTGDRTLVSRRVNDQVWCHYTAPASFILLGGNRMFGAPTGTPGPLCMPDASVRLLVLQHASA